MANGLRLCYQKVGQMQSSKGQMSIAKFDSNVSPVTQGK
jgi:hypothetical protein